MRKVFRQILVTTSLALGVLSTASASPVLITFGGSADIVPENLEAQGFVFSPSCHYDLAPHYLGFDRSGCDDPLYVNPNYLGSNATDSSRAFLYVARIGGGTFSLQSLTLAIPAGGFDVTSSAGGYELFTDASPTDQQFTDDTWANVSWIRFSTTVGLAVGFNDFAVDVNDQSGVPEPVSVSLVLLALAAAAASRRAR